MTAATGRVRESRVADLVTQASKGDQQAWDALPLRPHARSASAAGTSRRHHPLGPARKENTIMTAAAAAAVHREETR
jgi:hypothetical protein